MLSLIKAHSIRILVAEKLGLNPEFTEFAKLAIKGELHASQFLNIEKAGNKAVESIVNAGLSKQAQEAYYAMQI